MTIVRSPNIASPIDPIGIDKCIYLFNIHLSNIAWTEDLYLRAYANKTNDIDLPQVYEGNGKYHTVTPDNKKTSTSYWVISDMDNRSDSRNKINKATYDFGLIFNANLELIDKAKYINMDFTENLISDVYNSMLSFNQNGYSLQIDSITRKEEEIWREFKIQYNKNYLQAPLTGFRINGTLTLNPCI